MDKKFKKFLADETNVVSVSFTDDVKNEIVEYNVTSFINDEDVEVWDIYPDETTKNIDMFMNLSFIFELHINDIDDASLTIINNKKFKKFKRKYFLKYNS